MARDFETEVADLGAWRKEETIASLLPFTWANKKTTWERISTGCLECSAELEGENLRGTVAKVFMDAYRSVRVSYHVVARGYCEDCNLLTPIEATFNDDFTMDVVKDGEIVHIGESEHPDRLKKEEKPASFWGWLLKRFF